MSTSRTVLNVLPVAVTLLLLTPVLAAPAPLSSGSQIGEVTFSNFDTLQYEYSRANRQVFVATGPPTMRISSPRYEMTTPHFEFSLANNAISSGTATGGVHVMVRDPATQQRTEVICQSARYKRAPGPGNRGRIDLLDDVQTTTWSPGLSQPLRSRSKSGYIEFGAAGTTRVVLKSGNATVTPNDTQRRTSGG